LRETASSATAEGPRDALSVEILSTAAQLYEIVVVSQGLKFLHVRRNVGWTYLIRQSDRLYFLFLHHLIQFLCISRFTRNC